MLSLSINQKGGELGPDSQSSGRKSSDTQETTSCGFTKYDLKEIGLEESSLYISFSLLPIPPPSQDNPQAFSSVVFSF